VSQFRGPGQCLDIFNGGAGNNQPHLTNCANFTGQQWVLSSTPYPVVCVVGAPPAGFDSFYTKYCSVMGIPVLASAAVPIQALNDISHHAETSPVNFGPLPRKAVT